MSGFERFAATWDKVVAWVSPKFKAMVAGPASGAAYLTGIWAGSDLPLGQAFDAMTGEQWVWFALWCCAGWGFVWVTPNREPVEAE